MFSLSLAILYETGSLIGLGIGVLVVKVSESMRKSSKPLVCLPLEGDKFVAGMILTAAELGAFQPYYKYLLQNADKMKLSNTNRKVLGLPLRRRWSLRGGWEKLTSIIRR